jgi:hypothetical protein
MTSKSERVVLVEKVERDALRHVTDNLATLCPEMAPGKLADLRTLLSKYLLNSGPLGTREVSYSLKKGRMYAPYGTLQFFPRNIRNTVTKDIYVDLDFANCQPCILNSYCIRHRIPCPCLAEYCDNRSEVLETLCTALHLSMGEAKQLVLSVLFGKDVSRLEDRPEWLDKFAQEMATVRDWVVRRNPEDVQLVASEKQGDLYNMSASVLSLVLCKIENECLMTLCRFLQSKGMTIGVYMFDGCLVEKHGALTDLLLEEASDVIFGQTGVRLDVVSKPMTERLELPDLVHMPPPRFVASDDDASDFFLQDMRDCVAMCQGRFFAKVDDIWTEDDRVCEAFLLRSCLRANLLTLDKQDRDKPYSAKHHNARSIILCFKSKVPDTHNFVHRMWKSNIGVICYANGIYDFRRGQFFSYAERPDVMSPIKIHREFPAKDPAKMREVYDKVLLSTLGDPDVVETYLQAIARATAGEYVDKQWMVMMGERDCGKGVLQLLNEQAWQGYVNTINANSFMMQQFSSADAAKDNSWAIECEFKRHTYTNEVRMDAGNKAIKLDGNKLKPFQSGGDTLNGRKLYQNAVEFKVQTKLIMNLNDMPPVCPPDALSTMMLFTFPYKFVPSEALEREDVAPFYRLRDDTLKSEYCVDDATIDAFSWLVFDCYRPHRVRPCLKVINDTASYYKDEGDELAMVLQRFKVTKNRSDFVTNQMLRDIIQESGLNISLGKLKLRLVNMKARKDDDCCVNGVKHGGGFLFLRYEPVAESVYCSSTYITSPT